MRPKGKWSWFCEYRFKSSLSDRGEAERVAAISSRSTGGGKPLSSDWHRQDESTHKRTIEQLACACIPFATIVSSQIIRLYHSSETYLSHQQQFCGFCPHILLPQTIFFIIAAPPRRQSLYRFPSFAVGGSLILERKEKIMATEAQINANRRNSRNEHGPSN